MVIDEPTRAELEKVALKRLKGGRSFRQVARDHKVSEAFVAKAICKELRAIMAAAELAGRLRYKRIAIRLTERQRRLVFERGSSPIGVPDLRFHLSPDEATDLFGWLNDVLEEETDQARRKAIENLVAKMRTEEQRKRVLA